MSGQYFMGVDSGTQSCKVVITDVKGNIVCQGSGVNEPVVVLQPGWAEQNPEDNWVKFCQAVKNALAKFPHSKSEIVAIGLTGQRGTTTLLDKNGDPLRRFITWQDKRFFDVGQWYKNNEPEIVEKAYKISSVQGWLAQKLTGIFRDCSVYPPAGPDAVYALQAWPDDPKVYEDYGLPREKLMELIPPGSVYGPLTKAAAEATGLPEGILVIAAAGDKQEESLGAGVITPGEFYVTFGTAGTVLTTVRDKYPVSKDGSYFAFGSAVPGAYSAEGGLFRSHWIVTWFKEEFGHAAIEEAKRRGISAEEILNEEAEKIPPGSDGLIVFPFWDARPWYPQAKGMILGFHGSDHTRAHVFRAILEGISYGLRGSMRVISNDIGQPIKKIVIGGGGSKSKIGMQSAADIFGMPCQKVHTSETCALGAAITAAVGSDYFKSFTEAVTHMNRNTETFDPIPANVKMYNDYYEKIFTQIYPSFERVFTDLNELTNNRVSATKF